MPFEFNYDDARELAAVKVNTMTHAELAEYVLHDLCNLYKEKPWCYLDDKRKYHKKLNEQVKTPKV